jgi:hypothetical protein
MVVLLHSDPLLLCTSLYIPYHKHLLLFSLKTSGVCPSRLISWVQLIVRAFAALTLLYFLLYFLSLEGNLDLLLLLGDGDLDLWRGRLSRSPSRRPPPPPFVGVLYDGNLP